MQPTPHLQRLFTPTRGRLAVLLSGLLLVAACGGGGGGDAADASPGTTTPGATAAALTEGTITGFGSVIVNGVRFDDSGVSATDDDGQKVTLGLGMRVSIDSSSISNATARASVVRVGEQLTGPVDIAYDATAGTLTVLGQGVDVTSTTVFDDSLAAGVPAGTVVEVHGVLDAATGRIAATRIEAESGATSYKLRGVVSGLDSTAKTFRIGGITISYAGVATVPATLADGATLRVRLATTAVAGVWQAQTLGGRASRPTAASEAHVRGAISAFTSDTSFSVDGLPVDATNASFPDGKSGLLLGVQVEVEGQLVNGVLVAKKVELESRHRGDDDRKNELHGSITSVDTVNKTFVLRGVTVSYAGTVTYTGGTEAGLVTGAKVEVRGTVGSSRTTVAATSIKFES